MSYESTFAESEITPFENFDDSSNMSERNRNMCIFLLIGADSFEQLS